MSMSHGPVDADGARMRVITFDADGGAPVALRRLAAVLEAEDCALHNVWLGVPIDAATEQLVFVTLEPPTGDRAPLAWPPPVAPTIAAACVHEWDTSQVYESNPPQLRCRLCGEFTNGKNVLAGVG